VSGDQPIAAEFDSERMLSVLAVHGVRFVVIGGVAAALHGSRNSEQLVGDELVGPARQPTPDPARERANRSEKSKAGR
jgi:hypothetical protein